jgi:hypothetical protein
MISAMTGGSRLDHKKYRIGLGAQILILGLIVLTLHATGLWRGRLLDDYFILDKAQSTSFGRLLTEGLTVTREEAGDFWWIGEEHLFSYFRPLLLLTYKLPGLLFEKPDFWQHLINILLHLGTVLLVLAAARHITKDPKSAFLAALVFAVSIHHLLSVQWISGRKEPLIGFLLVLAFFLHLKARPIWAALALFGALLSGEQALVFPFLFVIWDAISREKRTGENRQSARSALRKWPSWALYFGVLLFYLVVRALVYHVPSVPVSAYSALTWSQESVPRIFLKCLLFVFSLTTSVPYIDKTIIEQWINLPLLFVLAVALVAAVAYVFNLPGRRQRAGRALLAMSAASFIPFLPAAALPFYLYTPFLFFSLAVGASLAAGRQTALPQKNPRRKARFFLAGFLIAVNSGAVIFLGWTSLGDFFKISPDALFSTARLLDKAAVDRNVLLVDVPAEFPPANFHFIKRLAEITGRDPRSMAFITDRPGGNNPSSSQVTPLSPPGFRIRSAGRPYFQTPAGRMMRLFAEKRILPGKVFRKNGYSVKILELAPETKPLNRGRRFYSKIEGVVGLEVQVNEGQPPPLVIAFRGDVPYLPFDMSKSPMTIVSPPRPGPSEADFLLRSLAGDKGSPPGAIVLPRQFRHDAGPKMGLGPLLDRMAGQMPVFRRAYFSFLRYLDEVNSRLDAAGGGRFRTEASNLGHEYYARAIEAMGGKSTMNVKSNALGVTWDSLMDKARFFAADSLRKENVRLSEEETAELANVLALAQIAAVANQVIPEDYLSEWEIRHPERPYPPERPMWGLPKIYWEPLRESIPWLYHAGALPWRDPAASNPLDAFETYHFFSHAWLVCFDLYRARYFQDGIFRGSFRQKSPGWRRIAEELMLSKTATIGYELLTIPVKSGVLEITRLESLPGWIKSICRLFGLKGAIAVESFRDYAVGQEGAAFGAALALSGLPLKPSDGKLHRLIIDSL